MKTNFSHLNKSLIMSSIFFMMTSFTPTVLSHSGAHPVRFVAPSGQDKGACNKAASPCKSINYAVQQSGKGDEVHVAAGDYQLQSMDSFYLLSDMVIVKGGYSTQDQFKTYNPKKNITRIMGLPADYRRQLAERGFSLLRDNKSDMSSETKQQLQQLDIYRQLTQSVKSNIPCVDGKAGEFPCSGIDLQSHMPLGTFSTKPSSANDIWGMVDLNDNKEYAIIGLRNGTAVVDVTDPESPREVGTILGATSSWRDVKVLQVFDQAANRYKAYAYVTTEGAGGGLQVIDLTGLPNSISLGSKLDEFSTAHNVYMSNVDYGTGVALEGLTPYVFVAGSNNNSGAFRIFDVSDPLNPSMVASPSLGTYVHDATSLVIDDERTSQCENNHNPCELFIDFNENTVDIWDVTNKQSIKKLSSTSYPNASYTHSGWWSQDKKYIFIQDELDEQNFGMNTRVQVLGISNLASPSVVGSYSGPTQAIDHNGFTLGDEYYMSNYRRGLAILDVSDPTQPTDKHFFDTFPVPSANSARFNGAWGTYPYLPSGNILVSDIEYGLFVLKKSEPSAGRINIEQSALSVSESDTSNTLSISRVDGSLGAVSLKITSANGSAQSGVDFQPVDMVLNWADGEQGSKNIPFTIIDDADPESQETFLLNFAVTAGEASLSQQSLEITINDNDTLQPGTIDFDATKRNVDEGQSLDISLTRSGGSDGSISIQFASEDGTAQASSDYTSIEGSLTWEDGETGEKTITITISDDSAQEDEESFTLRLSKGQGEFDFADTTIDIVISSNDQPPTEDNNSKDSGGSLGWFMLLAMLTLGLRRRLNNSLN